MNQQSKAVTTSISASSKISIQLKGVYYTVEFSETRSVPEDCDLSVERELLWDAVNNETDNQAIEIRNLVNSETKHD